MKQAERHFITEDLIRQPGQWVPTGGQAVSQDGKPGPADRILPIDFGEGMKNVYALGPDTEIVEYSNHEVHLSAHSYGKGRSVYLAGLPYSRENTRILLRSMFYAASRRT